MSKSAAVVVETPFPSINTKVRQFWERQPCGTEKSVIEDAAPLTRQWFENVENHRYNLEPFIHAVAQFTRHRGKQLLEVGVGAGTDHLQWARAGAECSGVDLTEAAINTTRARLANYGLTSKLQRVDAETLPFPDASFDVVYSWGVIHHSNQPKAIISEIRRVLRPNGVFIGMLYGRYSPLVAKLWVRNALGKGRPWRSLNDVVWNHMESIGTKAYTEKELRGLLDEFGNVEMQRFITPYDTSRFPKAVSQWFPNSWGWNLCFHAHV